MKTSVIEVHDMLKAGLRAKTSRWLVPATCATRTSRSPTRASWTGGFVGLLLFLALAGAALSTWLWFWLLQRTEAGRRQKFLSTPAGAKPEGKSGCCCG
jgi:hypothetical protein